MAMAMSSTTITALDNFDLNKPSSFPPREIYQLTTSLVCVFITAVPITKLFVWGEGDSGGHVLPVADGQSLMHEINRRHYFHMYSMLYVHVRGDLRLSSTSTRRDSGLSGALLLSTCMQHACIYCWQLAL